jgi:uncharacterized protein YbjT (DUF2867 family)
MSFAPMPGTTGTCPAFYFSNTNFFKIRDACKRHPKTPMTTGHIDFLQVRNGAVHVSARA